MSSLSNRLVPSRLQVVLLVALGLATAAGVLATAQSKREFSVTAYKYGYRVSGSDKAEIRVHVGDLVRIAFRAEDVAHSFTLDDDHYRISRRAEPGKAPVMFEFLADKPGRFEIYCNLSDDPRCQRETRAVLIVEK